MTATRNTNMQHDALPWYFDGMCMVIDVIDEERERIHMEMVERMKKVDRFSLPAKSTRTV